MFYTYEVATRHEPTTDPLSGTHALRRVLAEVHQRWGTQSLVYLDTPSSPHPQASPHFGPDRVQAGDLSSALPLVFDQATSPPLPHTVGTFVDVSNATAHVRGRGTGLHAAAIARRPLLPPWWPGATARDGRPLPTPPVVEVGGGGGRLTFMLAWARALHPHLIAFIDIPGEFGARTYPPSLIASGLGATIRPIIVRPPIGTTRETTRAIVDALFILLRSEAFDAVLCPFPAGARLSTATANTIASIATRTATPLLVSTNTPARGVEPTPLTRRVPLMRGDGIDAKHDVHQASGGEVGERRHLNDGAERRFHPGSLLGAGATYRLAFADHQWHWRDGEIAGLAIEVHTMRARGGIQASESGATESGVLATHTLNFHVHRRERPPQTIGDTRSANAWSAIDGLAEDAPHDPIPASTTWVLQSVVDEGISPARTQTNRPPRAVGHVVA